MDYRATCIHLPLSSQISSVCGSFCRMDSSILLLPVLVSKSAARPFLWYEFRAPITASLSSVQRYPLFTYIGLPSCSRAGSSTFSTRFVRLAITFFDGVLSIFRRFAVSERVSSSIVKCFIFLEFRLLFLLF